VAWLAAAVSVVPIFALAFKGAVGGGFSALPRWLGSAPGNSLFAGSIAATVIVVLGVFLGHARARGVRGSRTLDAAYVLSFVTPAAVLGVGLIAVWNHRPFRLVYGTAAILVVGYVARYAIVGIRTVAVFVAQTPVHLEEAAAAAGAGFLRQVTRILVPLHLRGLGLAWLLALMFCLRDLELPILYYPAGGEPMTVRIFTIEANGPESVVAALAVMHVAMTASVLGAGAWLISRRRHG
jgi:iron(III) transport system permease protein